MVLRRVAAALPRLALLAACLALPATAADDIRIVETRAIALEPARPDPGASHRMGLLLYGFAGSRWLPEEVAAAALASASLLAQCGVELSRAELRLVQAPRRFRFYSTPVSRELMRRIEIPRPAVFFVDDTLNSPAYDAEAIGRANAARRPELADTVWVAYGARDLPQALAHELVHVLSDSGEHSEEPGNLMRAETSPLNTRLSETQCARLRGRGEANGLLQPLAR